MAKAKKLVKWSDHVEPSQGYMKKVKDMQRTKFERCGVIPYYVKNGHLHFYVGVDRKYSELTDFGGRSNGNEDYIVTAVRELKEEARFTFEVPTYEQIRNCICLYNDNDIIIFIPTQLMPHRAIAIFDTKCKLNGAQKRRRIYNEMSHIFSLDEDAIQEHLIDNKTGITYKRFHELIANTVSSVDELKEILVQ